MTRLKHVSVSCCLALILVSYAVKIEAKSEDISNLKLELAQVVFRHGNRTPEYAYYNDPNAHEEFHPYGWDALDTYGRQSSYRLGEYLKKRYGDFVLDYDPAEVSVWSTVNPRTNMCAQLVAAGLFPPTNRKWDTTGGVGITWQPVPIDSIENPLSNDFVILLDKYPCPAFFKDLFWAFDGPPMQELIDSDPELFRAYEENAVSPESPTGSFSRLEILRVIFTIFIEDFYNMTVPDWAVPYNPDRFRTFAGGIMKMGVYTDRMLRLRIGPFLSHIIEQMDLKEKGSRKKIWLYSGHDHSVSNLGSILGVWEGRYIDFSDALLLELYSNSDGRYFVKVFFHNDTTKPPEPLIVPGCQELCPLNQFRRLFDRYIPEDVSEECFQV